MSGFFESMLRVVNTLTKNPSAGRNIKVLGEIKSGVKQQVTPAMLSVAIPRRTWESWYTPSLNLLYQESTIEMCFKQEANLVSATGPQAWF